MSLTTRYTRTVVHFGASVLRRYRMNAVEGRRCRKDMPESQRGFRNLYSRRRLVYGRHGRISLLDAKYVAGV